MGDSNITASGITLRSLSSVGGARPSTAYHGDKFHISYADGRVVAMHPDDLPENAEPETGPDGIFWRGF